MHALAIRQSSPCQRLCREPLPSYGGGNLLEALLMANLDSPSKRFWKWLTDSGFYRNFGRLHVPVYRMTRGLLGHRMGVTNLLLTTRGRKSGELRTAPLSYTMDAGRYVVVGSHGGADLHPAWWLNLQADPRATVMVGREVFQARASEAAGAERERLWRLACSPMSNYDRYQSLTDRRIPVVVLERVEPTSALAD